MSRALSAPFAVPFLFSFEISPIVPPQEPPPIRAREQSDAGHHHHRGTTRKNETIKKDEVGRLVVVGPASDRRGKEWAWTVARRLNWRVWMSTLHKGRGNLHEGQDARSEARERGVEGRMCRGGA